jgi:hypothetical protein
MVRVATNQTPHGLPSKSVSIPQVVFKLDTQHLPEDVDYTGFHGTEHMHGSDGKCYYLAEGEQPCKPADVMHLNAKFQEMRAAQIKIERARRAELERGSDESESDDEDIAVPTRENCLICRLVHTPGQDPCCLTPSDSEEDHFTKENPQLLPHGAKFYFREKSEAPVSRPAWLDAKPVSRFSPESSDDEDDRSQTASIPEDGDSKSDDDDSDKENIPPRGLSLQLPANYPEEPAQMSDFLGLLRMYDSAEGPNAVLSSLQNHVEELCNENNDMVEKVNMLHSALLSWRMYSDSTDETLDEMIGYLQDARDSIVNKLGEISPKLMAVVEQSPLEHQPRVAAQVFGTLVIKQQALIRAMQRKIVRKNRIQRFKNGSSRRGLMIWEYVPGTFSCRDMLKEDYSQKAVMLSSNLRFFRGRLQRRRFHVPGASQARDFMHPEDD